MNDPFLMAMRDWIEIFMRRSMHNFIQFAKQNSFSMSQINALFHLNKHGTCSVSDISEQLGITNAAASQLLDRLVQQNFILRTEDPTDRRNKKLVLTKDGKHIVAESIHVRQGWLADLAAQLNDAEKEQVVAALKILTEKANQLDAPKEVDC